MISAKYNWKIMEKAPSDAFLSLSKEEGFHPLIAKILENRKIDSKPALEQFLGGDLSDLHDPYLLHDMEKSVNRIKQAISADEKILVYGDYDADGMTSASIMKEALEGLGADVEVYLPNRFTDGYGPNQSVYEYFINQHDISLIVTVDNGVSGHEAITFAQSNGIDVIVTDHHSLPATLPNAYAIIHPEHPDGHYPFPYLAGCGVAFKLASALLESPPIEMLDLVSIGTIADMVSLTDENRILVKYGLKMLAHTERLGLQELMRLSGVDTTSIDEETVGFKIAPLLNALGRLDDPNPAIELLTGFDDEAVIEIARLVQEKNEERKSLVDSIYQEAIAMVDKNSPIQVLAHENWHPGVLGIVAGRLMEQLSQPIIVLNIADGKAKGSARSVSQINIFDALAAYKEIFDAFGGHAGAAGMTLPEENLATLKQILTDYISSNHLDKVSKTELRLDGNLDLSEVNLETISSMERLGPFGMDNPKPVFLLTDFAVTQTRTMGKDQSHLKCRIQQNGMSCDVLAFSQGDLKEEFAQANNLELAVTLSVNNWNGERTIQLMLVDARVNGIQLVDIRKKSLPIPEGVPILSSDVGSDEVVLLEVPDDEQELISLFDKTEYQVIYFKNHIKNAYYLTGYGTREQFSQLYKTVYQFSEFDIRYKLKELASYLRIPEMLLIKMIQIFEELNFVIIKDGVMTVNKSAEKRPISDSLIYQKLKKLVAFQELMALGTPQEIYDYLTKGNI